MTTGLIHASIFYFSGLILVFLGALFATGDASVAIEATGVVARWLGPLLLVPIGFVSGFFREQREQRRIMRESISAKEESAPVAPITPIAPVASIAPRQPSVVPPPPSRGQPAPRKMTRPASQPPERSQEVEEYLKQTSRVDLSGIKDYIRETRAHSLGDLHRAMEAEERAKKEREDKD